MEKIESLLKELGFNQTSNPMARSQTIVFGSGPVIDFRNTKSFVKDRNNESSSAQPCSFLVGVFLVIVAITESHILVRACQLIGGEDLKKDKRLVDGGLVWFTEVFTNEDEASALIRKANGSWFGPLYGPLFPAPSNE